MILIVGCGSKMDETSKPGSPIQSTDLPAPTTGSVTTIETEGLGTPTVTTLPPLPADPQRIEFSSEDGVNLVSMYYPAAINPAPMIVLMHWAGGDKNDWVRIGMTDWLTNRINFQGGGMYSPGKNLSEPYSFPNMPDNLSFGVFIFDFRGYGESDEEDSNLQAGWILDASAAY
jgi:pimeloyl-ACP methyl ester carboxylesterase